MTTHEIAADLLCNEQTVRLAIKRGELKARLFGGRLLVDEDDYQAFLQAIVVDPSATKSPKIRKSAPAPKSSSFRSRLRAVEDQAA